jgi:uncharacterized protein
MLIDRLAPQDCDLVLARVAFGRLACARDNQPYIVPIYFGHQPHRLYGFSTTGQKIEWMRTNPRVCVQVDEILGPDDWSSVIVAGRFEEIPDNAEYQRVREWAKSLLQKRSFWWQPGYAAAQVRSDPQAHAPVFYCIHIEKMTGLRATPGEKLTETWNLKS